MSETLFLFGSQYWVLAVLSVIPFLFWFGLVPLIGTTQDDTLSMSLVIFRKTFWLAFVMLLILFPLASILSIGLETGRWFGGIGFVAALYQQLWHSKYLLLFAFFATGFFRFLWERKLKAYWSMYMRRYGVFQSADELSDVRKKHGRIQSANYDAAKYWRRDDKVFCGLAETETTPVHIPLELVHESGIQLTGPSGFGKSLSALNQLAQAISRGECVIAVMPHPDDKLMNGLYTAACNAGRAKDFHFIDVSHGSAQRYAPFLWGTEMEIRERLVIAAKLEYKGTDSEVYTGAERTELIDVVLDKVKHGMPKYMQGSAIASLLSEAEKLVDPKQHTTPKLISTLRELNRYSSLQGNRSSKGINIGKIIEKGQILFVQGPPTDQQPAFLAQQIMLAEIAQHLARLDLDGKRSTHTMLLIDEAQKLLTRNVVGNIETLRKRRVTMMLAFHTHNSLRAMRADQCDPDYAQSTITENCQIGFHHMARGEEAKKLSERYGEIAKTVPWMDHTEISQFGAETYTGTRAHRQEKEGLFTPEDFITLPRRAAVMMMPEHLPCIVRTCWPKKIKKYEIETIDF